MSPVNGIELVTELRAAGSKVPIIMVSAHTELKQAAEAAGVDLFLDVPLLAIGKPIAEFLTARGLYDRKESA